MQRVNLRSTGWPGAFFGALAGMVYYAYLFPSGFLDGSSSYWQTQVQDVTQYLTGMRAYRAAPWEWPLLHIGAINWPDGTFVTFTDSIPVLAFAAKVFDSIFPANPYGIWVFACFVLMGIAAWWTARQIENCTWMVVVTAIALAVQMPAFTHRLGHLSLMAQFLVVLALGQYIKDRRSDRPAVTGWTVIVTTAFFVNFYITAMVLIVMAASITERAIRRDFRHLHRYGLSFVPIVVLFPLMYGFGFGTSLREGGYDFFSMNLFAPFAGGRIIRFPNFALGTAGQYEGFNYLGLGLMAGTLFAFRNRRSTADVFGPVIPVMCLGLVIYALSNQVYAGQTRLLEWSVPPVLQGVTDTFRVSGRFFWPVAYVLAFFVAASLTRLVPAKAIVAALLVVGVQTADLSNLRFDTYRLARRPAELTADLATWRDALGDTRTLYFYPKFRCGKADHAEILPMQDVATRLNIAITTGYLARYNPGCGDQERERANADASSSAFVYSTKDFDAPTAARSSPSGSNCELIGEWFLCKARNADVPR